MPAAPKRGSGLAGWLDRTVVLPESAQRVGLRRALAQFEWQCIMRALDASDGNVTRAAAALGIRRQSLQRKLKDLRARYGSATKQR
mgnify:CR=1 FL=1